MSNHVKKQVKKPAVKKVVKKQPAKAQAAQLPVEVFVFDCLSKQKVVAEHRHESKWWFGTRLYKVYHPIFKETEDNSRWVMKLGRVLGPIYEDLALPDLAAEREVIKQLMR